jgi:hypothetical protein
MIQPSLQIGGCDWAVKETKLLGTNPLLNEKLPVEIDVTNATIGSRVNKEGFIENGPRNLLTYSEDFGNAVWLKANISVNLNSIIAPDGTLTADKMTATTSDSYLQRTGFSFNSGDILTYSFYIKAVDIGFDSQVKFYDGTQNTNIAFTVTNEWQRVSRTFTASNTASYEFWIGGNRTLSIGENFYLWGAQVEKSSVATEYYPTTTRTNLARVDYSSGEAALLIEPQSSNILTDSNALANINSFQVQNSVCTAVSILDPFNSLNSNEYRLANASTNDQYIRLRNSTVYGSGVTHTYSIFVKYGSFRFCKISYANYAGAYAVAAFDLINGVVGVTKVSGIGSVVNNSTIQSLQNGWFRISISATLNSSSGNSMNFEFNKVSSANPSYGNFGRETQTTTTADFVYLFGAQLEQATSVSSYIPSNGAATTRNQDLISKTGISDLIGQSEGTFFIEAKVGASASNNLISLHKDLFNDNRIFINFKPDSNAIDFFLIKNNAVQVTFSFSGSNISQNFQKIAFVYKQNNSAFFINGVKVGFNLICETYAENTLSILSFNNASGSSPFQGNVKSLQLYKIALTDAQLITLTTI